MNRADNKLIGWLAASSTPTIFLVGLCTISCTETRPPVRNNTEAVSLGDNNTIISQSVNSHAKGDGTGTLIVKGKNNLIKYYISDTDIESYNTKTVTIVEGDNNNITSAIRKCVLIYKDHTDTLLIKGNQLKIDFKAENIKQLVIGNSQKYTPKPQSVSKSSPTAKYSDKKTVQNNNPTTGKSTNIDNIVTGSRNDVVLTKTNDSQAASAISVDTIDKNFDWGTTEGITKLTGFETVYVFGLEKDMPLLAAIAYYTKQAQQENYEACYQLGLLYDSQTFAVLADLPRAIQYYERAARHNHATAAFRLGQVYEFGDFELGQVIANRAKAKYYYSLAAQNSSLDAKDKLANWHD